MVAGGLILLIESDAKGYNYEESSTKLEGKRIPKVSKIETTRLTEEDLKQIAENNVKYGQFLFWMGKNSDAIFSKAPHNEIYAVGVWKKEKPEIHYFNDKWKEVLPLMKESTKKGDINTFVYKYQREVEFMFYAA